MPLHAYVRLPYRLCRAARRRVRDALLARGQHRMVARNRRRPLPPDVDALWPLPTRAAGISKEEIRRQFERYDLWHYAYEFVVNAPDGSFESFGFHARHAKPSTLADSTQRPLQRFRHFMPYLLQRTGGSFAGITVLDIGCNSGFWSFQCALLGAREVIGFDARPELIEQAELVKSIVGLTNVRFQVLDFDEMTTDALGGRFDVVLNLGILYHLPDPFEVLERTRAMARRYVLLDTAVSKDDAPLIRLHWEEPVDIRDAASTGVVAYPSHSGVELILRHLSFREWLEIPIRTMDMPPDYLSGHRASWLISL